MKETQIKVSLLELRYITMSLYKYVSNHRDLERIGEMSTAARCLLFRDLLNICELCKRLEITEKSLAHDKD